MCNNGSEDISVTENVKKNVFNIDSTHIPHVLQRGVNFSMFFVTVFLTTFVHKRSNNIYLKFSL